MFVFFFFQAEDGIRDLVRSRGLGDVYKRQNYDAIIESDTPSISAFGEGLRQASRFGNTKEFKRLIEWGIPHFGVISINWRENGGFSALDCAAANGHVDIVRVLARLGGSQLSNTPDDYSGMTPLLWAAQGGHWECIKALCENYSDLDVTDRNVRPDPNPIGLNVGL
eukprot:TRINITY_DN16274_c0_g1_i2.p1 TRINITY_DN16274_c0_g1~~TRINITY_DN16274_c0_g1_i2.p1  ORF type:complete len:167 (-),score=48.65 TRINITY_DN16274_c0_g1_i2:240-740(-)